jgi:protein SCO1
MQFIRSQLKTVMMPVLAALAGFGAVAVMNWTSPGDARFGAGINEARWGQSYLPNLPVVDQDGNRYRFYDDLIKDRKVVINFIFTSCSAICPLTMARMAQLHEKLSDIVGRDVQFYSITVDPEHDGPRELKRYADAFKIGPGWRLLTGLPDDIQIIRNKLGERARLKTEHRHEMLLGNVAIGDWSKDSVYGDLDRVVMNIRAMDPNWRLANQPTAVRTTAGNLVAVRDSPGEGLFIKACASCHTIGNGDRVGPDLRDVAQRRDQAWLTTFISRPDLILASDDPIARALKERFPTVVMPNLGLSADDATDVLEYIRVRSQVGAELDAGVIEARVEKPLDHRHP